MMLKVLLKIFSGNELSVKAVGDSVGHLKTANLFIGFCVVYNEGALCFLFIVCVAADVNHIISGAHNCWLSSNFVLAIIDRAVQASANKVPLGIANEMAFIFKYRSEAKSIFIRESAVLLRCTVNFDLTQSRRRRCCNKRRCRLCSRRHY